MVLEKNNDNTLWADDIAKYMRSVQVVFSIIGKGDTPPPVHQFIRFHMVLM